MADLQKPRPPGGLGVAGRRQWRTVISDADGHQTDLDSRELTWLEDASRCADTIACLEAALANADGFMVKGVAGQPVAHPLLAEIRQTRALRAQLLARITVTAPEEKQSGTIYAPLGVQQRAAALQRWGKA